MAFTNESKPGQGARAKLNIGDSFKLIVGGVYDLIVGAGGSGMVNIYKDYKTRWDTWSLAWQENTVRSWDDLAGEIHTNIAKVSVGETWATIETTWATETRDWLAVSQLMTNVTLEGIVDVWASRAYPWQQDTPWS